MINITFEMEKLNIYELQKLVNLLDVNADKLDSNRSVRVYERTEGIILLSQLGKRIPIIRP